MLINKKHLYYINNNNFNIFIIKNDIKNVIYKFFFIISILNNVTNYF